MFSSLKLSRNLFYQKCLRDIHRKIGNTCQNSKNVSQFYLQSGFKLINNQKWMTSVQHNSNRQLTTAIQASSINPSEFKEEEEEFMAVFPDLVKELVEDRKEGVPQESVRIVEALNYSVPIGEKNRGLAVISSYKQLEKPENITKEGIRLANVLGWCVELLQGYLIVVDDYVDGSKLRRGSTCWYLQPGIGSSAIYDGLIMGDLSYSLLNKYFSSHPAHMLMTKRFQWVSLETNIGQLLDLESHNRHGKPNLEVFDLNRVLALAKYKNGYIVCLPVIAAMYLANIFDEKVHRPARNILLDIGQFYQIQDDYRDCFVDTTIVGKNGTDIENGKCCWPAVTALQRATPAQRTIMEKHYGRSEPESVAAVRRLYDELDIEKLYHIYEKDTLNRIHEQIEQLPRELSRDVFYSTVRRVYKGPNRQKYSWF